MYNIIAMEEQSLKPDGSILFKSGILKTVKYRTTQKLGRVRAVPRLCSLYPGNCLTIEEKARKILSQGSHT
jgi:hypothetical protein